MKRIIILCATGISSCRFVETLQMYKKTQQLAWDVKAYSIAEANTAGQEADIIVLTPQVRFNLAKIQQMFPNKEIRLLDQATYETQQIPQWLK